MTRTIYFFLFSDTPTTEIYTLSLHDALPICAAEHRAREGDHDPTGEDEHPVAGGPPAEQCEHRSLLGDRKSTRLNSSHPSISYAVFCLKKKIAGEIYSNPVTVSYHLNPPSSE